MKQILTKTILAAFVLLVLGNMPISAQKHDFQQQDRKTEALLIFERLSDVAIIDIVRLAGPPKQYQKRVPECAFQDSLRGIPNKFYSYIFFPKKTKQNKKYPLVVMPHGGVHAHFSSGSTHIVRELLAQGYIVVAPDYRGSTGYGKGFYEAIDYGGLENEDVLTARDYMVRNYSIVDSTRVGIVGWSHGGMIALMNILHYPDRYAVAYAGVPVSDVGFRLSYQHPSYADNFTPVFHVGGTPEEKPEEYARRSPVTFAKDLQKPLFIKTCANDEDVGKKEVMRMIDSLKFYGKEFEYEVFPDMPGAHHFERIDTEESTDVRYATYKWLEKYLKPPFPFKSKKDMRKAGYFFY